MSKDAIQHQIIVVSEPFAGREASKYTSAAKIMTILFHKYT